MISISNSMLKGIKEEQVDKQIPYLQVIFL